MRIHACRHGKGMGVKMKNRKLFLCCDKKDMQTNRRKVTRVLGSSVTLVDAMEQADLVYAVGKVSPGMQQQLKQAEAIGIPSVCVNDNLINEEVCARAFKFRSRITERGR